MARKTYVPSEASVSLASSAFVANARRAALCAPALFVALSACDYNLPVDDPQNNPAIPAPSGVIQGTVAYLGPSPCFKNGGIEGMMVVLLFDYAVPPPPDGLATTALNLATIPGEKFFANAQRPASGAAGSAGSPDEYCPDPSASPINAASDFTISELHAGDYQVRAFYNRKGNFNPLFDFLQLPSSGDVLGGAVIDPTQVPPSYQRIRVGNLQADGTLQMPSTGFVAQGVPVVVGQLTKSGRPYFYVDYAGSTSFTEILNPPGETTILNPDYSDLSKDFASSTTEGTTNQWVTFPQDIAPTLATNITSPNPLAPIQASFPQLHLMYGFPGTTDPTSTPGDAFLAAKSKPAHPFVSKAAPYYGIDPLADTGYPEAQQFLITRRYAFPPLPGDPGFGTYAPAVLEDNAAIGNPTVGAGMIDLFPQVIMARLQDDGAGGVNPAIVPATDPAVVIQGITLRNGADGKGTMQATSMSAFAKGALAGQPNAPLAGHGEELISDMTALIRPAALCIDPLKSPRGVITAPTHEDPSKGVITSRNIVDVPRTLAAQATLAYDLQFGCVPPGYYEINVVYATGQAWTMPNLMGGCTFTVTGAPTDESCFYPNQSLPQNFATNGFDQRPMLQSQALFATDPTGAQLTWPQGNKKYQLVYVAPSLRCMQQVSSDPGTGTYSFVDNTGQRWINNPFNEDLDHNGVLGATEDINPADGILELNIADPCLPRAFRKPGQ
ncbi:MAG: hypothetical protein ACHREM_12810 [Polyangiales bacterium]